MTARPKAVSIRPAPADQHVYITRGRRTMARRQFFRTVADVRREMVDLDGHGDAEPWLVIDFHEGGQLQIPAPEGSVLWVEPERH